MWKLSLKINFSYWLLVKFLKTIIVTIRFKLLFIHPWHKNWFYLFILKLILFNWYKNHFDYLDNDLTVLVK